MTTINLLNQILLILAVGFGSCADLEKTMFYTGNSTIMKIELVGSDVFYTNNMTGYFNENTINLTIANVSDISCFDSARKLCVAVGAGKAVVVSFAKMEVSDRYEHNIVNVTHYAPMRVCAILQTDYFFVGITTNLDIMRWKMGDFMFYSAVNVSSLYDGTKHIRELKHIKGTSIILQNSYFAKGMSLIDITTMNVKIFHKSAPSSTVAYLDVSPSLSLLAVASSESLSIVDYTDYKIISSLTLSDPVFSMNIPFQTKTLIVSIGSFLKIFSLGSLSSESFAFPVPIYSADQMETIISILSVPEIDRLYITSTFGGYYLKFAKDSFACHSACSSTCSSSILVGGCNKCDSPASKVDGYCQFPVQSSKILPLNTKTASWSEQNIRKDRGVISWQEEWRQWSEEYFTGTRLSITLVIMVTVMITIFIVLFLGIIVYLKKRQLLKEAEAMALEGDNEHLNKPHFSSPRHITSLKNRKKAKEQAELDIPKPADIQNDKKKVDIEWAI